MVDHSEGFFFFFSGRGALFSLQRTCRLLREPCFHSWTPYCLKIFSHLMRYMFELGWILDAREENKRSILHLFDSETNIVSYCFIWAKYVNSQHAWLSQRWTNGIWNKRFLDLLRMYLYSVGSWLTCKSSKPSRNLTRLSQAHCRKK